MYAYPAMYNYFLTQFFTPLRAFYLNDAEYTYKHRSPETIAEKLNAFKSVRGYDVKQFDLHQSVVDRCLYGRIYRFS